MLLGGRPPPGAVDGQPRPARAHARAPPHRARLHAAARGRRWSGTIRATVSDLLDAIDPARALRPRRRADLPAAGDDRLQPHRRAARGLRAAQALVRLSRRTDLRASGARGAGRARREHRRLPRLPARPGRRARRAPHRRPHERADRHPRRGPRGVHARRDRLDLLLAELRRARDDELPHRQRHAAAARGPRALGARRRRPGGDPRRRGGDAALRSVGLRLAARDDAPGHGRRGRPARRARSSSCGWRRPGATRRSSPSPTPSTSTARTPAATSPSAAASTTAWARASASSRPSWPSRSSRAAGRGLALVEDQELTFHPNISFRGPQALWVVASLGSSAARAWRRAALTASPRGSGAGRRDRVATSSSVVRDDPDCADFAAPGRTKSAPWLNCADEVSSPRHLSSTLTAGAARPRAAGASFPR